MDAELVERGQHWLEQLLQLFRLSAGVTADLDNPISDGGCWLVIDESNLTPEQIHLLTGEDGSVLDSIQYLANSILNMGQNPDHQGAFTVELAGYRIRRHQELQAIAQEAAAQVRETGAEFELKSLSSAERRQVHTLLKQYDDLETFSRGQEPDRRLVVKPLSHQD